jgi:hypothetical protein
LICGGIRYSTWPPGRHLGFRILDYICRTGPTQLISYFGGRVGWVGGRSLSIFGTIQYSIWPPDRHLGFHILYCNCITGCPIDFIFLWHRGVGWGTCPIDLGTIRYSIWPLGILDFVFRTMTPERAVRLIISFFCHMAGWVGGGALSMLGAPKNKFLNPCPQCGGIHCNRARLHYV